MAIIKPSPDLIRAHAALSGKLDEYDKLFSYAEGQQPLVYSTNRLKETFGSINAHFEQNWCAVVVDSVLDRISLKGFTTQSPTMTRALTELWNNEQLALDAYDAHYAALVTHESFIIVWKDKDDKLEIYYNDPRLCHMFYDTDNPKKKKFACKWWHDESAGYYYLTLYYSDRLEYYSARAKSTPTSANSFLPMDPPVASNPYGIIPVFHLRTNRRSNSGDLANILTIQDAVNKLLADMMVAAEFGAYRQRWVISNSDTSALKNAPNEIWSIPAGDGASQQSSVGDFQPTDLNNYLGAMDKLANSVAIITRTPKHYFYNAGSGISGEALLAMEAPLTKKVKQREENFGVTWQEIASFLLKLNGDGEIKPSDIKPIWEPPLSIQPLTESQSLKYNVEAGIPLITQLKRQGWTDNDLKTMKDDKASEKAEKTSMAAALLEKMKLEQEQQNSTPESDIVGGNGNLNA